MIEKPEFQLSGLCYEDKTTSDGPHKRISLKQCNLFNEIEIKSLSSAVATMEKLFSNIDRSIAAEEACREFVEELKSLTSDNKYDIAKVDRRFRAYVMEFRLFLDHWKKYISDIKKTDNHYGGAYERLFNDITSEIYDSCDEYVLATVIRNYVVHGYDSINAIHVDGYNNRVYIERDNLFKIKMSASAKEIVKKQPEKIDLVDIAEKSLESLNQVQEALMNFQITEDIGEASITLLDAKKRIDDANIKSDFWILIEGKEPTKLMDYKHPVFIQRIKDENGNPVTEEKKPLIPVVPGINLQFWHLNWIGYVAVASYISNLWKKGYWLDIQKKYSL